jgi:Protein of unknown function (DUF4197)
MNPSFTHQELVMPRTCIVIASAIFSICLVDLTQANPNQSDSIGSKIEQQLLKTPGKGKISSTEAAGGLKEALAQGVNRAIKQLGREDGFNKDPLVRILVPEKMRTLSDTARKLGAGKKVDQFELSMNRAAEKAIPVAADIFADAVRQMTVQDAIDIVRGKEDAGTQFFRRVTEEKLREKFVADATSKTGVTQSYKKMAGKNSGITQLLGGGEAIDLDRYVTDKTMDGLYHYVAEQEKDIRKDPSKRTTDLLRRVFGK